MKINERFSRMKLHAWWMGGNNYELVWSQGYWLESSRLRFKSYKDVKWAVKVWNKFIYG